jgi:hypothetical protein
MAKKIVTLAADHLAFRLPGLGRKRRSPLFDPAQLADHRQSDRAVIDGQRRRYPHPAVRRIYSKVQIFYILADNLHGQAAYMDLVMINIHLDSLPG